MKLLKLLPTVPLGWRLVPQTCTETSGYSWTWLSKQALFDSLATTMCSNRPDCCQPAVRTRWSSDSRAGMSPHSPCVYVALNHRFSRQKKCDNTHFSNTSVTFMTLTFKFSWSCSLLFSFLLLCQFSLVVILHLRLTSNLTSSQRTRVED